MLEVVYRVLDECYCSDCWQIMGFSWDSILVGAIHYTASLYTTLLLFGDARAYFGNFTFKFMIKIYLFFLSNQMSFQSYENRYSFP